MANSTKLLAALAIALLGACASPAATSKTFGPFSPMALLIMSAPPGVSAETFEFRRVDLERAEFRPEIVRITNAGLGGQQINNDTKSGVWLSLQQIPPGDYALVSLSVATVSGVSSILRQNCLNDGAPVFALPIARISIVRTEPYRTSGSGRQPDNAAFPSDEVVLREFATARDNYPDIGGQATIIKPKAVIAYADKRPNVVEDGNRSCAEPRAFTRAD